MTLLTKIRREPLRVGHRSTRAWRQQHKIKVLAAAMLLSLASLGAQEKRIRVEVRFVTGKNVYVSPGRTEGLRKGDRIVLELKGGATAEGRIENVARTQARAIFDPLPREVRAGVRGYALIKPENAKKAATETKRAKTPEHPPWQRKKQPENPNAPLLRMGKATTAAGRPTQWRGRNLGRSSHHINDKGGSASSTIHRLGLDTSANNPLGYGGEFSADVELTVREADRRFSSSNESRLRLDEFSYHWGRNREQVHGFSVGRFYQREASDLGLLDGVEYGTALDEKLRLGLAIGFLPEPFPAQASGDDFALSAAFEQRFGDGNEARLGLALQKTWHKGSSDRDLAIARFDWSATEATRVYATAWIDLYDSSERVQDSGIDLTELHLQLRQQLGENTGVSLYALRMHWPDLLRQEFGLVAPDVILNEERRNIGVSLWHDFGGGLRVDVRGDHWSDRFDSGKSWDLTANMNEWLGERTSTSLSIFGREGSYVSGPGFRASWLRWFDMGSLRLSYEYSRLDFGLDDRKSREHGISLDGDLSIDQHTSLGVTFDHRTGTDTRAYSASIYVQYRF